MAPLSEILSLKMINCRTENSSPGLANRTQRQATCVEENQPLSLPQLSTSLNSPQQSRIP